MRYSGTAYRLVSVFFDGSQFIAAGDSGTILTSSDGATWIPRLLNRNINVSAIVFGNGRYVATADLVNGFMILSSSNDSTLSVKDTVLNQSIESMCYHDGLFVALTIGTIMTSTDGATWIVRDSINLSSSNFSTVGYGNGRFVAVGNTYSQLFFETSDSGTVWTSLNLNIKYDINSLTYGNGTFIGVGSNDSNDVSTFFSSTDGTTWTTNILGTLNSHICESIIYAGGSFVAVGSMGTIETSPDGKTWTPRNTSLTFNDLRSVAFGAGGFVAAGTAGEILASPDGQSWAVKNAATTNDLLSAAYGNNRYMAVGNGGTIISSPDGSAWTAMPSNTTDSLYFISYCGNRFVAVGHGNDTSIILSSADGSTWSKTSYATTYFNAITYGNNQYVAAGSMEPSGSLVNSLVMTSPDAVNWTTRYSDTMGPIESIAYGNGKFVATGYYRPIVTSSDGLTWKANDVSPLDSFDLSVYALNNEFLAVGQPGGIFTSSDSGNSWTLRNAAITNNDIFSVSYGNGQFVAAGENGSILSSSPGSGGAVLQRHTIAGNNLPITITYANNMISLDLPCLEKNKMVTVGLFNAAGKQIYSTTTKGNRGTLVIPAYRLPVGMYVVSVASEGKILASSKYFLLK